MRQQSQTAEVASQAPIRARLILAAVKPMPKMRGAAQEAAEREAQRPVCGVRAEAPTGGRKFFLTASCQPSGGAHGRGLALGQRGATGAHGPVSSASALDTPTRSAARADLPGSGSWSGLWPAPWCPWSGARAGWASLGTGLGQASGRACPTSRGNTARARPRAAVVDSFHGGAHRGLEGRPHRCTDGRSTPVVQAPTVGPHTRRSY